MSMMHIVFFKYFRFLFFWKKMQFVSFLEIKIKKVAPIWKKKVISDLFFKYLSHYFIIYIYRPYRYFAQPVGNFRLSNFATKIKCKFIMYSSLLSLVWLLVLFRIPAIFKQSYNKIVSKIEKCATYIILLFCQIYSHLQTLDFEWR